MIENEKAPGARNAQGLMNTKSLHTDCTNVTHKSQAKKSGIASFEDERSAAASAENLTAAAAEFMASRRFRRHRGRRP